MIYEIKFTHGKQNMFASSGKASDYQVKDDVIIRAQAGKFFGRITRSMGDVQIDTEATIVSMAGPEDYEKRDQHVRDSQLAMKRVNALIEESGLGMCLVAVNYNHDKSQLFISFTAEKRVDFRQLLRNLSENFHTSIELRQIGIRDVSKIYGGIGPCGRPICCSEFLYEFPAVSIKMAKNQQLSLNQAKLNGLCGRLMCCLTYEDDFYKEASREFPDFGDRLTTADGIGRVIGMNILSRTIKLRFDDMVREYTLEELEGVND